MFYNSPRISVEPMPPFFLNVLSLFLFLKILQLTPENSEKSQLETTKEENQSTPECDTQTVRLT